MPSSRRSSAELGRLFAGVLLALALTACGGAAAGALTVEGAWVRASMGTDSPTAAYLVIRNSTTEDEVLLAGSTDVAGLLEIHRSVDQGSGMHGMEPVESIHIPAGGTSTLEPGGLHLMLFGLREPLEPGDTVTLRLEFENAGSIEVAADVRAP
jgi:periplasmic copper chaperone A